MTGRRAGFRIAAELGHARAKQRTALNLHSTPILAAAAKSTLLHYCRCAKRPRHAVSVNDRGHTLTAGRQRALSPPSHTCAPADVMAVVVVVAEVHTAAMTLPRFGSHVGMKFFLQRHLHGRGRAIYCLLPLFLELLASFFCAPAFVLCHRLGRCCTGPRTKPAGGPVEQHRR